MTHRPTLGVQGAAIQKFLDFLSEPAGDNFAGKFLPASKAPRLTVTQGLRHGVMVGRLPDVVLHFAREYEGKIQSAEAGSAPEANVPVLVSKTIRSRMEVP